MFYDKFLQLCESIGISPSRAAIEAGVSKSLVSKWKNNKAKDPSPDVARKLANYFGITVSELLDEETKNPAPKSGSEKIDNLIKLASELSPEQIERLLAYGQGMKDAVKDEN